MGLAPRYSAWNIFCREWQRQPAATPQEYFKMGLFTESQRSQKSVIHSPPASFLTLLLHTDPLGSPAFSPGLAHPAMKLPQVEIREQMKAGRRQDRGPVFHSSTVTETSSETEPSANILEPTQPSGRLDPQVS